MGKEGSLIIIYLGSRGGKEGSANHYFLGMKGGGEGRKSNYYFFGFGEVGEGEVS